MPNPYNAILASYISIHIENGIVFCIANTEVQIDLERAKAVVAKRLNVCNGKSFPTFFDLGAAKYASKEVRDYLTKEGSEGVSAAAFHVNNIATKLFIDCYLAVHKPAMPTKIFSDKEHAVQWLKQFVQP